MVMSNKEWHKINKKDTIWWRNPGKIGDIVFSFNKKTEFYLFGDYPGSLTEEQREIFDKENPRWAKFIKDTEWYKQDETDTIWWKDNGRIGEHIFSFDKKTEFNLFADYPYKLTKEQKEIFDKENPEWKEFFRGRQ